MLVTAGGRFWGRFLMTPAPESRPNLTQRLVAVSLADLDAVRAVEARNLAVLHAAAA